MLSFRPFLFYLSLLSAHYIISVEFTPYAPTPLLPLIVSLLGILSLILFSFLLFLSPGRVRFTKEETQRILECGRAGQVCTTCETIRPVRSKHCAVCNICIGKFDHHCAWTDRCIGSGNHRLFFLFLSCLSLDILFGLLLGYKWVYRSEASGVVDGFFTNPTGSICMIGVVAAALFVWPLFLTQFNQISTNITTNEVVNKRRYVYLWTKVTNSDGTDAEDFFNPFHQGLCRNWLQFCFHSIDWSHWPVFTSADIAEFFRDPAMHARLDVDTPDPLMHV
eukprot:TRINITY_DN1609_c0_g1::TRINITY_DN1609_c0_g1_i2::g.17851::m.17851 TRINITY_DN1609_c0_g1::TRINITY_DN1609_c0_g1_i2::g.17851  ORF type:complete len:278 (+),score=0.05,sp/Q8IUH5/ZDH17_HUMAN/36.14/7e-24,zf-DHHC/PF01529.15/1.1e+03,zf-DHHC/PF01529.15/2.3e-31,UCR_Fe-S_N/PF10399.4/0.19,DUF267/PF03268.9/0.18 TRINITY_DN1609_c0_g1_i2:83-916(+)